MYSKATLTLLFAALAAAGPISRREVASLDPAATAEAHQRDATATRAFSNVQIKTSDGKCLSVDPLSGDFRANLTPIQITDCGSAQGQGWDVITSGVHNDQKGQALIVSTLTQACFNFDPRRAAGNQVLLFSCGGRADGGGSVTNSQLFAFTGGNGPLSLTPENDATKCLVPKGNLVDIADCSAGDATQKFTIGGSAGGSDSSSSNNTSSAVASSAAAAATSAAASSAAAGSTAVETQASATSAAVTSVAAVTDAADAAAATTLTVLATSVHTVISCAPTVTNCPARSNQTAIASLPESAKTTVVVTDTVVLATTVCPIEQASSISSSLQAAHSSGLITGSTITATTPAQAAATATAAATTTAASSAATGAAPGGDENAQCSAPKIVTVSEVVTVTAGQEAASVSAAAVTSAAVANNAGTGSSQTTAAAVSQPAITGNPTTPVPVSGAGGTLNPTAAAEANPFDATAVRPVQSVNVRAADGRCLSVNPTAGDFRENLIPIQMVACNQEDQSQKFDIVTKGAHNDGTAGEALLVSVLTNGCVNFDGRRAANDQVIMFSCGGRADGSGKTTTSQLFPFKNGDTNIILTPASATNQTCLIAGADRVEAANCDNQKDQVFQLAEIV
ncbi:hypothetical protein TRIATDRAFT_305515 [Trichoderma atroviride IMI 206040]|uniref:Ricin B lectin domain-containing protein n=1 Tax=Hypocrea atroviridis (strain ATCC 20476 / IMI 206040) TaxID=452589 RepID=G9NLE8_HYPAI|nr:uncharacterized protein TRIATDRAFT_305515 [Trichoderma atroviride IMI 206040]EHK48711.1 hypothetical protein TRIATDRAFT_305515 [Trichoderma atroviride IMI 206040]